MTTSTSINPLLNPSWLPRFEMIKIEDIEPAIHQLLQENQDALNNILQQTTYTWNNLIQLLDDMDDRLSQAWSPISHLHAVMQSDALRNAYNVCLPLITGYHTQLMQHQPLFEAIQALTQNQQEAFDFAQQKVLEHTLRDFHLAGVHLSAKEKAAFLELEKKLSHLTTQFSENLLDATQAWFLAIDDKKRLAGLPDFAYALAEKNAKAHGLAGWAFTLDYPSYSAVMKFLDDRELRKTIYQAYMTRASDLGTQTSQWDNSQIMLDILACRHELAQLVDFNNYAEYSLATKMVKQPTVVMDFLHELLNQCKPFAKQDIAELKTFVASIHGPTDLAPWDIAYYSEKLRLTKFNFSEEEIKPYFPIQKVMAGLFTLVNKIYGLQIQERSTVETWHPDVKFFDIYDAHQTYRGGFYIDLYARAHKREGAWMDDCRVRRRLSDQSIQQPVAYLTCNFTPPLGTTPALLTHDEVLTLFHEFGHCLHHLLTKMNYAAVSGIHGVPWDAVEFPSQFMELFFWEKEVLQLISGHYQTGEPLPEKLHQQLLATKHFQSGMQMLRQLEFALFDFRLHLEYQTPEPDFIQNILNQVREKTALLPVPSFNRFQHSFAHIFAGGYAAGYYSYAWADVLSCDAYAQFAEKGLLNRTVGEAFMQNILEQGGACDPLEAFIAFRGRKPEMTALLKQNGWIK